MIRLIASAVTLLGLVTSGCSSGRGYAPQDVATGSLPPRPTAGMVRDQERPYGDGYGLGRGTGPTTAAGDYRWNGNPERIKAGAPPGIAAPRPPVPVASANGERTIEVRPGDTLYSLARQHGVTVAELAEHNNLMTSSLKAGQRLSLPAHAR